MKKLFYLTSLIAIVALSSVLLSWDPHCDHVYTTVVQPEVKVERVTMVNSIYEVKTGKHQGDELICVKCFHRQIQVVDYGPEIGLGWPPLNLNQDPGICPTIGLLGNGIFKTPAKEARDLTNKQTGTTVSAGLLTMQGDTIILK